MGPEKQNFSFDQSLCKRLDFRFKSKEDWLEKAGNFSIQAFNSDSLYLSRNSGGSLEKNNIDRKLGKVAEEAVADFIDTSSLYGKVHPDYKVYTEKRKSWEADLDYGDFKVHVKSSFKKSSMFSVVFQYRKGTDALFHLPPHASESQKNIIFSVLFDDNTGELGTIVAYAKWSYVITRLGEPFREDLKGIKKVWYEKDMVTYREIV
jgi:hypothetical protein